VLSNLARTACLPACLAGYLSCCGFFSPLGKLADRLYILPSVIFFTTNKAISLSTAPIVSRFFSPNGICVNFRDPVQSFFRFLKGRCHGNQFCGKITYPPAVIALAFRHGMGYRYLNVRINSVNNACISRNNFVNFGAVTQRKRGSFVNFLYDMAKNWRI